MSLSISRFRFSLLLGAWILASPVSVLAQFQSVDADWNVVDVAQGTKPSFDFDSNGDLHVMGITEQFPGVVWHATAADLAGPWNPTVVSVGYFYGPGDLRVDQNDTAHIAWHDHDEQDSAHVSVASDGSITSTIARTPDTHDGWDNSLAITSNNEVVMASIDPGFFGATNSLLINQLGETGWSSDVVEASGAVMYGLGTSLAFDDESSPHVLYTDARDWAGPGGVVHASQNDVGLWSVSTIESGEKRWSLSVSRTWPRQYVARRVDQYSPGRRIEC